MLELRSAGVLRTSQGVGLSSGLADGHRHYAVSRDRPVLDMRDGDTLARVILWLTHPDRGALLVRGPAHVWHLIVDRAGPGGRR